MKKWVRQDRPLLPDVPPPSNRVIHKKNPFVSNYLIWIVQMKLVVPDPDGLLGVLDVDVVLVELVEAREAGQVQLHKLLRLVPSYKLTI